MDIAPPTLTEAQIKVERILNGWQFGRDLHYLRDTNGKKCVARQAGMYGRLFSGMQVISTSHRKTKGE